MRAPHRLTLLFVVCLGFGGIAASAAQAQSQSITAAGQPAQLDVRAAGERSIRITLKPVSVKEEFPVNPAVVDRKYPAPALSLRELTGSRPIRKKIGALSRSGGIRPTRGSGGTAPTKKKGPPPWGRGAVGGCGKR